MTHPLSDLDGKRKYVFSKDGEDFYLRVVTTNDEMLKHQDAAYALSRILHDSTIKQQEELKRKGERLKGEIPEIKHQWREETLPHLFETEKNFTAFILENGSEEFVTVMLMSINDPQQRLDLQVPEDVGTFVYVDRLSTAPEYQGKSIFSSGFDKVLTMMSNPKRCLQEPFLYSVSMTAVTAIREDEKEVNYVMNLARYTQMWQERFIENRLQNRWHYYDADSQYHQVGMARAPLDDFLSEGKINESAVDALIKDQEIEATIEGKEVRRVYLEGIAPDYSETKIKRRGMLERREDRGLSKKDSSKTPWLPSASLEAEASYPLQEVSEIIAGKGSR